MSTDLVIILSSDWVGSTATRAQLGEEPADALQEVHDTLLRRVIAAEGGTVVKHYGDGVLATFNSATAALSAAVKIQQDFAASRASPDALARMDLRIGLAAGDVKHQAGDIFGLPVVEAVRLQGAAAPNEILCSDLVRVLSQGRGGFEFEDAGVMEFKGLPAPVHALKVRRPEHDGAAVPTKQTTQRLPQSRPAITQGTGRKLNVLITGLFIGVVFGGVSIWLISQDDALDETQNEVQTKIQTTNKENVRDVLADSIAQIEKHIEEGNWESAFAQARRMQEETPFDPRLADLWPRFSQPYTLYTNPAGARIYRRSYNATSGEWDDLGVTPIENIRLPRGLSLLRFELEGYEPILRTHFVLEAGGQVINETITQLPPVVLDTTESHLEGMVRVPGWTTDVAGERTPLRDFFINRYEVTNREFKVFVDAGGYRRPELWQHPIMDESKEIPWAEAMLLFVDRTGRAGPSAWEVGDYPEGQDNYPVGGVSWYEAAAYAQFAKQELPSVHHWQRAFISGEIFNELAWVMPANNLNTSGMAPVGQFQGVTWVGAYDMAGNVREWTLNAKGERRVILGGGWNDPHYMAMNMSYAQSPLDRSETNGFRLVSTRDDATTKAKVSLPVPDDVYRNYAAEEPVSDEIFTTYQRMYSYDSAPFNTAVETMDSTRLWKRERISFDAAYGGERMILYLYLPATGTPPYQTVLYWPGSAYFLDSIDDYPIEDFLIKDGRAVAFPVYKGLFERGDRSPFPELTSGAARNISIQWINDLRRSIDYLETRADIDPTKFSYFGISWGADNGPLALTMEPRLRVAVLYVGGVYNLDAPEIDPVTYLPRVNVPVLMLNGEFDSATPLETSAKPFYEMLGTQEPDKKFVVAPGGHFVPRRILIRETLDWLDKYLGSVN